MTDFEDKISLMIPAYLRGDVSESERQEIEAAAAKNPSIAADIEFQRNLKTALKSEQSDYVPGELDWARLSKAMEQTDEGANDNAAKPAFWRYTAIILAAATVGQAGILGSIALNDKSEVQYAPVSEIAADNTLKLGFNPATPASQITETLQSVNAVIIAGPSSLGLYDIKFAPETNCESAVKTLKSKPNVVDTLSSCK